MPYGTIIRKRNRKHIFLKVIYQKIYFLSSYHSKLEFLFPDFLLWILPHSFQLSETLKPFAEPLCHSYFYEDIFNYNYFSKPSTRVLTHFGTARGCWHTSASLLRERKMDCAVPKYIQEGNWKLIHQIGIRLDEKTSFYLNLHNPQENATHSKTKKVEKPPASNQ